nr:MAG TPA_asm: hypothetical protein [Caudoviricetes sp.]
MRFCKIVRTIVRLKNRITSRFFMIFLQSYNFSY